MRIKGHYIKGLNLQFIVFVQSFGFFKERKLSNEFWEIALSVNDIKLDQFYLPLAQISKIFELIFLHTHSSLLD